MSDVGFGPRALVRARIPLTYFPEPPPPFEPPGEPSGLVGGFFSIADGVRSDYVIRRRTDVGPPLRPERALETRRLSEKIWEWWEVEVVRGDLDADWRDRDHGWLAEDPGWVAGYVGRERWRRAWIDGDCGDADPALAKLADLAWRARATYFSLTVDDAAPAWAVLADDESLRRFAESARDFCVAMRESGRPVKLERWR